MHIKHKLARFAPLLLFAALTVLLTACPGVSGGNNGNNSGAPQITSFTATPSTITAAGQSVTLSWAITGSPTSLSISGSDGTNLSSLSGTNITVNPTATTTYTLTATNSSGSDDAMTTVTVGGTVPPPTDGSRTVSFGVSLSQTGPFSSDADGNISAGDPRIVNVSAGSTFYAQVTYSGPSPVTGVTIYLANSSPAGFRSDLVAGTPVNGFTLGTETSGCITDGTQTSVTCTYPIDVAPGTPNITGLAGAGSEFAYVLRTRVTDTTGTVYDQPPRGYVTVGGSSGGGTPPTNPPPTNPPPTNPPPTNPPTKPPTNPGPTAPKINSFTANPATITSSQNSTLSWNISGTVTKLSIDNGVGDVTGENSVPVEPKTKTTYTLTANNGTASATSKVTVDVTGGDDGGGTGATTIKSFNASPAQVTFGEEVKFTWSLGGTKPSKLEIFQMGNPTAVVTDLVNKTSANYEPQATATYYLQATTGNDVKQSPSQKLVTVATAINNYKASPARVAANASTTLSWSLSGPTPTSISINPPSGAASSVTVNTTGSYSVPVSSPKTGNYVLTVKNSNATSTANASVTVNAVINTFTATPTSPVNGNDFTLTWTATGADGYTVSLKEPGDTSFEKLSDVNPNGDDVVRTAQSGTYTLKLQSGPNSITKNLVLTVQ